MFPLLHLFHSSFLHEMVLGVVVFLRPPGPEGEVGGQKSITSTILHQTKPFSMSITSAIKVATKAKVEKVKYLRELARRKARNLTLAER